MGCVMQLIGGVFLSPLLVGMVQSSKAKLQGRIGASMFQPYRDLRKLWAKTGVAPIGTGAIYRIAPALVATAMLLAVFVVPVVGSAFDFGLGHDALVVAGLLALARFSITLAAFDTRSGFSLMGASRDLTLAVLLEGLFVLVLIVVALPVGSTNLAVLCQHASGLSTWARPFRWCAASGFALVVLGETGRQPIDNPDTHLELTMIHEGPVLEYAGRDLAMLQWAAAVRHWVLLVLALTVFLPHFASGTAQMASLLIGLPVLCGLLGLTETWQARMRLLVVPRLLCAGGLVATAGFLSFFAGAR